MPGPNWLIWFTDTESTTIGVIDPGAADSGSDDAYWEAYAPNWRNRKNSAVIGMGKTIVTLSVLGLLWLGYVAWPLYDLYVLVKAFEMRDVETVLKYVYFDSVRRSLSDQIVAAAPSVALATGRHHPSSEYSEFARG
jgi:hypothetical protein